MLLLPLYFLSSHAYVLKLLSIVNFGNLETFIYWLMYEGFIKSAAGGLLSAYNMYVQKTIYYCQAMLVYLHLLACFLMAYNQGRMVLVTNTGPAYELNGFAEGTSSGSSYLHYLEFGFVSVLNLGSFVNVDGSSLSYGIMIPITFISSGFFVVSVLLICGLIMALNRVEDLTQEEKEDLDLWYYGICMGSGPVFPVEFEKKLFKYFDFVQDVSVTEILEQHFFFKSMTVPLQDSLKKACVKTLADVFKVEKEIYSEAFLNELILLCKPIA